MPKNEMRFVNLQLSNVTIFNQKKRNLTVSPFHMKDTHAGTFVCEGAFFRQFVAPFGPLSEYPDTDSAGFKNDQVVRDDAAAAAFDVAHGKGAPKSDSTSPAASPPPAKSPAPVVSAPAPTVSEPDTKSEPAKSDTATPEEEVEISLDDLRKMSKSELAKFAKANGIDSTGSAKAIFDRLRDKFFPED